MESDLRKAYDAIRIGMQCIHPDELHKEGINIPDAVVEPARLYLDQTRLLMMSKLNKEKVPALEANWALECALERLVDLLSYVSHDTSAQSDSFSGWTEVLLDLHDEVLDAHKKMLARVARARGLPEDAFF